MKLGGAYRLVKDANSSLLLLIHEPFRQIDARWTGLVEMIVGRRLQDLAHPVEAHMWLRDEPEAVQTIAHMVEGPLQELGIPLAGRLTGWRAQKSVHMPEPDGLVIRRGGQQ